MSTFETIYQASLIGTFLVLVWYAYETRAIRKVNVQQKDLQLLPVIMFYVRERSGSRRLFIRNIGGNPAMTVDILPTNFKEGNTTFRFIFRLLDENNTLIADEERGVGINLTTNGKHNYNPLETWLAYYDPENLKEVKVHKEAKTINGKVRVGRNMRIRFRDVTGQRYETTIKFSYEGISVKKEPTRL